MIVGRSDYNVGVQQMPKYLFLRNIARYLIYPRSELQLLEVPSNDIHL